MRRSLSAAIVLLVLAFSASSAFADGPSVTGELEAHKIVLDKKKGEIAVSADKVFPRDMVEYTLRYRNSGGEAAAGVSLLGPVPAGTVYLEETATDNPELHPLFSIDDGKTFQEAPVTYVVVDTDGTEKRVKAPPEMITHVRWMLGGRLGVGQEVSVSYRVQVK